jgi:hypothetical protein
MRRRPWAIVAVVSTTVVSTLSGYADAGSAAANTYAGSRTDVTVSTSQSELAAVKQVRWTSNVTVSVANGSWAFRSDGVPASTFTASHYAVPENPLAVNATGASVISTSRVLRNQK